MAEVFPVPDDHTAIARVIIGETTADPDDGFTPAIWRLNVFEN